LLVFIDHARIRVEAGRGGNGCLSFRREKCVPRGGPDGGNGGKGGDVILKADRNLRTLADFYYQPHYKAASGTHGQSKNKKGKDAPPLILSVPEGTLILNKNQPMADLLSHGQQVVVARGGRGGRGNASFKTMKNPAPRIAEKGEPGEKVSLNLELKLLADVGLVGYPNAGKSTLLSVLSSAHPKVAPYPFTTLVPHLGVVLYKEKFLMADIPGLIEGAHQGKGLGDEFLRHVERTKILIHLVDVFGYQNRDAFQIYQSVNRELQQFHPALSRKPQIIAVNKMDMHGAEALLRAFRKKAKKRKVFPISAIKREGLKELLEETVKTLGKERSRIEPEREKTIHYVYQPDFFITKEGRSFVVAGRKVENLVAMTDFAQKEAVHRLAGILKKMGIERVLAQKGARRGDQVRIGEFEFTFVPGEIKETTERTD